MDNCFSCNLIKKKQKKCFNILELYSGIGGMHCGILDCGLQNFGVKINVFAIDINTNANLVYLHNFLKNNNDKLLQRSINSITADELDKLEIDICTMSPPCQPFTRQGLQLDDKDVRTDSVYHLINEVFPKMKNKPKYFLIENVKTFETSKTFNAFLNMFKKMNYNIFQLLLQPFQFGVPNSRPRFYCLVKKNDFCFENCNEISEIYPIRYSKNTCSNCLKNFFLNTPLLGDENNFILDTNIFKIKPLKFYLEDDVNLNDYLVREEILNKYISTINIVNENCFDTNCFTKSYSTLIKGAGSMLLLNKDISLEEARMLKSIKSKNVKLINLRFLTPNEIKKLMHFPEDFKFPNVLSNKQMYKLIGNSVNVKVISYLLKILLMNKKAEKILNEKF